MDPIITVLVLIVVGVIVIASYRSRSLKHKNIEPAADFCVSDPAGMARRMVDAGFTPRYDYAFQTLKEVPYNKWREYDPEDTIRFYGLRLREAGMIKSLPNKIIADATEWRFLNELKRELKG